MVAFQNTDCTVARGWQIPVKNTFINFDLPPPSARCRASSCPPDSGREMSWEDATQELCHAMAPTMPVIAVAAGLPTTSSQTIKCGDKLASFDSSATSSRSVSPEERGKRCGKEVDAISDISTTSGEALLDSPIMETKVETWSNVPSRKKTKARDSEPAPAPTPAPAVAIKSNSGTRDEVKGKGKGKGKAESEGKGKGKGKGLSHFQRVEVGIDDDRDFRVLQRLIGPRGSFMQDIVTVSKGAKVWIIGKGSRSWEDDVGPLQFCVGASSTAAFDSAINQVNELLDRVRAEHKRYLQQ